MPIRPRSLPRQARPSLLRHWSLWAWFVLALTLSAGGVALWKSGRWLVREDSFEKVGWGVVLAGESRDCERSDAAIRMHLDGKIDTLVLSSMRIFKNRYQGEFLADYYASQGVRRDRLFEFRQDAYSTIEEARLLVRQFRLQDLDTVLIITSDYHTARTRNIFNKLARGYPAILVASADYNVYDPDAWWTSRESMKIWLTEWTKTFFTYFELARSGPEIGKAQYQGLTPDIWSGTSDLGNETKVSGEAEPAKAPDADSTPLPTSTVPDSAAAAAGGSDSGMTAKVPEPDSSAPMDDSVKAAPVEAKTAVKDSVKKAPRAPRMLTAKESDPPAKSAKETPKKGAAPAKSPSKPVPKKNEKIEAKKKRS